jgi:cytochrome c oxidase assembly protein subunit 11
VPDTIPWSFTPTQSSVKVIPGETALAFYTAKNNSKKAIVGVATYNVIPSKAGKISKILIVIFIYLHIY